MAESNLTYDQEQHVESHAPYLKVFFALLILTILEYGYAKLMSDGFVSLILGLMVLAIIKASLVAWYFMHLKFEGRWVYLMLVPAGILMMVLILALYPDIGMQRSVWPDYTDEEEASAAPLEPSRAISLRA